VDLETAASHCGAALLSVPGHSARASSGVATIPLREREASCIPVLNDGLQVRNPGVAMASSRIALVVMIPLLMATVAFSQDEQQAPASTQSPASYSSQPDAPAAKPVRVPGNVASAMLIHQVTPEYPAAAKEQHIEGTIVLHALIGKDGTLQALKYVSGAPALMQSAMDAVKQWVYKPTLLNGEPVEVDTTISVLYTLGGKSLKDAMDSAAAQPPSDAPQPDSSAPDSERIRVGGNVASASIVHQVTPVYPPIAKVAHISGTVLLHAIIAKDGTIEQLDVVSGPPLLLKSAMDAVRQWVYRPTLVNGEPFRVDTTVSVVFSLDEKKRSDAGVSDSPSAAPGSSTDLPPTATVDPPQYVQKDTAAPQTPAATNPETNAPADRPRPKSIRVGGNVAAANLIHQVTPAYPKDAKKHHIQGTVLLHAIIAQDGTIKTVQYVSGPPELTDSAIEAVKEWRYKPTLLRGEAIEVDTTISVVYRLGN